MIISSLEYLIKPKVALIQKYKINIIHKINGIKNKGRDRKITSDTGEIKVSAISKIRETKSGAFLTWILLQEVLMMYRYNIKSYKEAVKNLQIESTQKDNSYNFCALKYMVMVFRL